MDNSYSPEFISKMFAEFWDKSYDEIHLSMAGMADIWEGPSSSENGASFDDGTSTIIAVKIYNDRIYIAQGGGLTTFIKVVSPSGIEIYDLGSQMCLMTSSAMDIYGGMAVINDEELILGYMYINLKMLFMAPYGIDMASLWRNSAQKIVPVRVSSTSWVVAMRDSIQWRVYVSSKESPEDCLPCESKKGISQDGIEFECTEEEYGRSALNISGYKSSRSGISSGASLSVTRMGGFGRMDKIKRPPHDDEKCFAAIDEYTNVFNRKGVSPADVGEIGQKMSSSCSKIMYLSMLEIVEYKSKVTDMYNRYIKDVIAGNQNNSSLIEESLEAIKLIVTMLGELDTTSSSEGLIRSIFSDQIWWGPIWFSANKSKVLESEGNAYTLLNTVEFSDFSDVLMKAASTNTSSIETEPLKMGWIVMSKKGKTPIKYSKQSMTYFRFPFALCMSTRLLMVADNNDFDSICEVETRGSEVFVWAWVDKSTLKNKQFTVLRCYKVSKDGVLSVLDEVEIGYSMSPIDDSAKSVGVSPDDDYWIVRDYYIKDSQNGGIGYVESKVSMAQEMQDIMGTSAASYYANCNEMHGMEASADGTLKYRDGVLERDWEKFDLDDDQLDMLAWGNDGPQYRFVSGYTGYQIHASGEL